MCTPGKIRVQLPIDSYIRLREGVAAGEESRQAVGCHVFKKSLQAQRLQSHLESTHDIYQQVVVPNDLLEERAGIRYEAERVGRKMPIRCPFPGCPGTLSSAYMLCRGPMGRTVPMMQAVRDAVQPRIPPTHPLAGVSDGGRVENTEGLGHHVGLGPPAAILR